MNKFHALCCAYLLLPLAHSMKSAEIDKWNAREYKENSSPQFRFAQWALQEFESRCGGFKRGDHVVDLGCGNGKITESIAQRVEGGFVHAIDSSADMIKQARVDCKTSNISFEIADMSALCNANPTMAVVTAFCSIHWVKDQEKVYQNIPRVLKSNGTFVGLISDKNSSLIKAYYNAFEYPQWNQYFKNYTPSYYPSDKESIEKYLHNAGLTPITVEKANIPMMTMHEEYFVKMLAATPGVKDAIPQELYMDFIKNVVAEYVKVVPKDETGKIKIDAGLLLVLAQKP